MIKKRYKNKIGLATIAILTILLSVSGVATAETVIYSEGFEADNGRYTHTGSLDQWQWGVPTFTKGPSAHSGNKLWGTNLAGEVPYNSDSYLTSPAITIPALEPNEIARVRFFAWISVDYMYDRGEFQVSKDRINWETKAELLYNMSGNWEEYYFDVSDYSGGNIYLRFRLRADSNNYAFIGSPNMAGLYVDDVAIIIADSPAIKTKVTLEAWEDQSTFASCPWLYTWDGSNYVKDNDIYSTAKGADKEYTDYYLLNKPLVSKDGKYSLQLRETDNESSYTDMVQLKTIDHPSNVKIANDENGNILTYSNPNAPNSAVDKNGNSILSQIVAEDNAGTKVYHNDSIDLDFSSLNTSNGATFVLHVLGFQMDGELGAPTNENPYIYIQTKDANGNWVTRNVLYPRNDWTTNAYNLAPYLTESKLVRLLVNSCNVGKYHIIDYAGLDISTQSIITVNTIQPVTAVNSVNGDVLSKTITSDNIYASMSPTEAISLEFPVPAVSSGEKRDFIFVSEGYYLPTGTFFMYTWDGSKWAQRDGWSIEGSGDKARDFDLSIWLPDPSGEYKVKIWQDYWYEPAGIDYVGITKGDISGTMTYAYDMLKSQNILTKLQYSDNVRNEWGWSEGRPLRNRWVEVRWTGLGTNTPPTINTVSVTNTESLTPTISWTYSDIDGDSQMEYQVEVWTGPSGTGTNEWSFAQSSATDNSVVYAGNSLVGGKTYYARVRSFDGTNWGGWSEISWIAFEMLSRQISNQLKINNYPENLLDPDVTNILAITWLSLDPEISKLYYEIRQSGMNFDNYRIYEAIKARDFLNVGDIENAKKHLGFSLKYSIASSMAFMYSAQIIIGSLSSGMEAADTIRGYSETTVTVGLYFVNPLASTVADYLYIPFDYVIDKEIVGEEQARKDAAIKAFVSIIMQTQKFDELGGNTIEEYIEQSSKDFVKKKNKYILPIIKKAIDSPQGRKAALEALKQSMAAAGIEITDEIGNKIVENWIEQQNMIPSPIKIGSIRSPGELRVYDSQGYITGLVNGNIIEDIPYSIYDKENKTVIIYLANDMYRYEIAGTDAGTYGLDMLLITEDRNYKYPISVDEIPIYPNSVHRYTIVKDNTGGDLITFDIDADGDGSFEETSTMQSPKANFVYSPNIAYINQDTTFDASSSNGNITSYEWDFGDGTNLNGKIINHRYSSPGIYTAILTVKDNNNVINKKYGLIQVISDLVPPTTISILSGTPGNNSWYISDVQINLTATDNEGGSGVNNIEYSFDNTTWNIYTAPFNISNEGITTLYYYSTDNAGNIESTKNQKIKIDKTPPEAAIRFNITSKDIKVYNNEIGSEASFTILPTKKGKDGKEAPDYDGETGWEYRQYTLKDLASNSLVLILEHKKEGNEAKVKVLSAQYNGGKVLSAAKNKMQADYSAGKNGALKELNQKIEVKRLFDAEAEYNANKNQTEIKVKGQNERRETKTGMVILELLTDKGGLTYWY